MRQSWRLYKTCANMYTQWITPPKYWLWTYLLDDLFSRFCHRVYLQKRRIALWAYNTLSCSVFHVWDSFDDWVYSVICTFWIFQTSNDSQYSHTFSKRLWYHHTFHALKKQRHCCLTLKVSSKWNLEGNFYGAHDPTSCPYAPIPSAVVVLEWVT